MGHGDTIAFVERPSARYGKTIDHADAERLLADPVEFSQNLARILTLGVLDELLMNDVPRQVEDLQQELEFMVETAIRRKDIETISRAFTAYSEFIMGAVSEAREYGVALGAVMEQLRSGLVRIVDLSNRGLTFADMQTLKGIQELRREHNLKASSTYEDTDLERAEKQAKREG